MICKQPNKVKWFQVLLYISNNSIRHQSFVYTQLNDQTVLFLTIQVICLHTIILTHRFDPISCYHSGSEWTWLQWRDTLHSPKLQHYWSLTMRLFSVISRILVREWSYPSAEMQLGYSAAPADLATGHLFRESYPSAEMPLACTTVPADWASGHLFGESYLSAKIQLVCSIGPADWAVTPMSFVSCHFDMKVVIFLYLVI